jgi:hypothetical protein
MSLRDIASVLAELRKSNPNAFRRAHFLNELRKSLKILRGNRSQSEIAERMKRDQSEISRLENSVTNYTRIGSLLDYIEACDGNVAITLFDSAGTIVSAFDIKASEKMADRGTINEVAGSLRRYQMEA